MPLLNCCPCCQPTPNSAQQEASSNQDNSEHDGRNQDHDSSNRPAPRRPTPPTPPTSPPAGHEPGSVVLFRVLRGGGKATAAPEQDLVGVSPDQAAGGADGLANTAQTLRDFLFLVRSSQPGSIGEELQRRGVRVWPEEAFVDCGGRGEVRSVLGADVGDGRSSSSSDGDEMPRFGWMGGVPLPLDTPMAELPRDEEGRVRLVLWDPCGEDAGRYGVRASVANRLCRCCSEQFRRCRRAQGVLKIVLSMYLFCFFRAPRRRVLSCLSLFGTRRQPRCSNEKRTVIRAEFG